MYIYIYMYVYIYDYVRMYIYISHENIEIGLLTTPIHGHTGTRARATRALLSEYHHDYIVLSHYYTIVRIHSCIPLSL